MRRCRSVVLLLLATSLLPLPAPARQVPADPDTVRTRPSIGIALGGGGARGLAHVAWRRFMTDRPDRSRLTYRRKTDDLQNVWPFEIGITSHGLSLQRGLIYGQKFNFALRAPDLYTAGYDGFDNLPIPFRAVATDLVTCDIVVPDRGNLIRAVRASGASCISRSLSNAENPPARNSFLSTAGIW